MRWFIDSGRIVLFSALVAAIVGVASERMFWYWSSSPVDHPVVTYVYGFAVAGMLWVIDRYRVRDFWGLALVTVIFGFLVEGAITPITYTGGPFVPFFPVWFGAWHGGISVLLLVVVMRRWALADERRRLLWLSTGLGGFWGLWSLTLALPENVEDPELIEMEGHALHVLSDTEFAVYALWGSAMVAVGHYLLGRWGWRPTFRPGRVLSVLWLVVLATLLGVWTVAIPWAAPMFVVYVAFLLWALRRLDRARPDAGSPERPSVLTDLQGSVRAVSLLPLAAMPVAASAVYSGGRLLDPSDTALRVLMYGIIVAQTLVWTVVLVKALRRAWRAPRQADAAPEPVSAHEATTG